jgi:hypothetical protein
MEAISPSSPEVTEAVDYVRRIFGGRTGNEKLFAFTPITRGGGFGIGVAILGDAGYLPDIVSETFADYAAADLFCSAANKSMGYSDDTAQAIVIDTMRRSEFNREQKSEKVSVKLDLEQLEEAIHAIEFMDSGDTDVLDVLNDAKEELLARADSPAAMAR